MVSLGKTNLELVEEKMKEEDLETVFSRVLL